MINRGCSRKKIFPIKIQFSLIFIACMAGVVLLCIFLNTFFLEKYYLRQSINTLKDTYSSMQEIFVTEKNYTNDEIVSLLNEKALASNISIVVVDSESETLFVSMNSEHDMQFTLLGYILGQTDLFENPYIYEEADTYVIRNVFSRNYEFIEMLGQLSEGVSFLMRIPISSMHEAASIANKFFVIVGVTGTIIGSIFIFLVSGRVTKPIKDLNSLSEKMVNLDFEARYYGKDKNEIGVLGDNMNVLSETLKESIYDLKSANEQLQEDIAKKEALDEMRKEFISNVSHELKTPIAIIQGYAEGLKEGITDDPESTEYYCDVIVDEAAKMNSMVKQLMNLNQLEVGAISYDMSAFDLDSVIKGYIQSAAMLGKQDEIEIIYNSQGPIMVYGDEYMAEEVLTNYFSNAVHYCLPDFVGKKQILIYTENDGSRIKINVFNTGNPIPEDSIERLWEKFYKVDKARTREYGGSGVGLSIVKAIQEGLGMGYGVQNNENGVTFWYELEIFKQNQ